MIDSNSIVMVHDYSWLEFPSTVILLKEIADALTGPPCSWTGRIEPFSCGLSIVWPDLSPVVLSSSSVDFLVTLVATYLT